MFVFRVSLLILALIVSVSLSAVLIVSQFERGYWGDFLIFWKVGLNPVDWLYTDLQKLPFPYPPSSLWLFQRLSAVPFWEAFTFWNVMGLTSFVIAARQVASWPAIILGLVSFAAVETVVHGQTSLIVAALVILGITDRSPITAGIALGLAAAIKPQSVIAVPFALLLTKEYRTLLCAVATAAAVVGFSALVWGVTPWLNWISSIDDFYALIKERNVEPLGLWPYGALLAPFALPAFREDRYVAVVVSGVLLSPYTMPYDLVGLAVVSAMILLDPNRRSIEWVAAALVFSGVFAWAGVLLFAVQAIRDQIARGLLDTSPIRWLRRPSGNAG